MSYRPVTSADSKALNHELTTNAALLRRYEAWAAEGIVAPKLCVIPRGARVFRFAHEDTDTGGNIINPSPDRMRWKLSPWWFPESTYQLIVAHASQYFQVAPAQVTPYQFASTARKGLAVWLGWGNKMNVFVSASIKHDTIAFIGDGARISMAHQSDPLAAEARAHSVSAILPLPGAKQFFMLGIGYHSDPALAAPQPARETRFFEIFTGIALARFSVPQNRHRLGLPARM